MQTNTLRGNFVLVEGARLKYVPSFPPGYDTVGRFCTDSDGQKSLEVKERYNGQRATFKGYAMELVGPLNWKGLWPGIYSKREYLRVEFDDGMEYSLNANSFVALPGLGVHHVFDGGVDDAPERVGDLPHPVLFYPGDKVWIRGQAELLKDNVHEVRQVFVGNEMFAPGGIPRYEVMETDAEQERRIQKMDEENLQRPPDKRIFSHQYSSRERVNMRAEDLELAERGSVWALYEDPSKLRFDSDEEELAFWGQEGISYRTFGNERQSFALVYKLFEEGSCDIIRESDLHKSRTDEKAMWFEGLRLYDCFAEHRKRVRAFTKRFWAEKMAEEIA